MDAGIRNFVDLTCDGELRPYEKDLAYEAGKRGTVVGYERWPISQGSTPEYSEMRSIQISIDELVRSGEPVYLHCMGGRGRTGIVVAIRMVIASKANGNNFVQELEKLRSRVSNAGRSPETREQVEFVRKWLAEFYSANKRSFPVPSKKALNTIADFLEPLERYRASSETGTSADACVNFLEALYENRFVPSNYDYLSWENQQHFFDGTELVPYADLKTCCELLMYHARGDHFQDYYMSTAIRAGKIGPILKRLRQLISE